MLIVPRANPDGAYHFVRGLANGADVNRDHLLEATPEGRALGRVFVEFQPDVVLDCHEFGVKLRWYEKFGALQRYDALIQYATVSNLPRALTDASERLFRVPLVDALDKAPASRNPGTTRRATTPQDRVVSMGGVSPDTGRNIAGLRNAVSFLIETRGVGIGRAHYKRRVYTHLVAMHAMLDAAARDRRGGACALAAAASRTLRDAAGHGTLVVAGSATPARHTLDLIDPATGADRAVEVDWRSALEIEPRSPVRGPTAICCRHPKRPPRGAWSTLARRSCASKTGSRSMASATGSRAPTKRARTTCAATTRTRRRRTSCRSPRSPSRRRSRAHAGDFYVPLDQPLANVIAAALEPDTQSSYAANHLLTLPAADAGTAGLSAALPRVGARHRRERRLGRR